MGCNTSHPKNLDVPTVAFVGIGCVQSVLAWTESPWLSVINAVPVSLTLQNTVSTVPKRDLFPYCK